MPRGDRTGPQGAGPMTGRGAGTCAGAATPGYAGGGYGRGGGRGGRGRGGGSGRGGRGGGGWGRCFPRAGFGPVAPTPDQELNALKQRAEQLKADMECIEGRIQELEAKPE